MSDFKEVCDKARQMGFAVGKIAPEWANPIPHWQRVRKELRVSANVNDHVYSAFNAGFFAGQDRRES